MINGAGRQTHPAVAGGLAPPPSERQLGAGIAQPIERGQGDVGPHRRHRVSPPGADHFVDDLGDPQSPQYVPHRGGRPEGQVAGAIRHHGGSGDGRFDVLRLAQVALRDDLGFAPYPGHLPQVVVGLPLDLLANDRSHVLGHTLSSRKSRVPDQDKRAGSDPFLKKLRPKRSGSRIS